MSGTTTDKQRRLDSPVQMILCGCYGRMGAAITNMVGDRPDMDIVLGTDRAVTNTPRPYPVRESIGGDPVPADVIVSYLPPTAKEDTLTLLDYSVKHKMPIVVCTTGLSAEMDAAIAAAAKETAVFYSGNMSLGINVMTHILKNVAGLLYDSGFDIELIEKHHNKKIDVPSGTALMLLDALKQAVQTPLKTVTDRSQTLTARSRDQIGVSAVRGGNIIGEHSVLFAGQNETIEITHAAQSRDVFADGTLKAAAFMQGKPPGLYTMEDLIQGFMAPA